MLVTVYCPLCLMAQQLSIEQQVPNLVGCYNDFVAAKDVNGLLDLYWDWMDYPPVDRATMKKVIEDRLKNQTFVARLELLAVETRGRSVGAKVRCLGRQTKHLLGPICS